MWKKHILRMNGNGLGIHVERPFLPYRLDCTLQFKSGSTVIAKTCLLPDHDIQRWRIQFPETWPAGFEMVDLVIKAPVDSNGALLFFIVQEEHGSNLHLPPIVFNRTFI